MEWDAVSIHHPHMPRPRNPIRATMECVIFTTVYTITRCRPTVSLGVTSVVVSSCGHDRGSHRATRCALIRGALGDLERARETYTTPPSAARSARCAHAGASLQTSRADPEELHRSGTLSRSGTTRWRTREEKRPNRLTIPRDAMPARLSYFRLLAMASPHWMLVGSY